MTCTLDNIYPCSIALRLRRDNVRFRDLTIRARRDTGSPTELDKMRAGRCPRWYFYGWYHNKIDEWIFINVHKALAAGLLNNRPEIANGDGTYFIAVPLAELHQIGSLLTWDAPRESRLYRELRAYSPPCRYANGTLGRYK